MTEYNTLNAKLANSQLNKIKYEIKNDTVVTLIISSKFMGDSNYENNYPHKLLLTNTHLCKAFANGSSGNLKSSKNRLHKIRQSGGFLGRHLEPLLKNWTAFSSKCT